MANILTSSKYDRLEKVKDVIVRNFTEFLLDCYVGCHIKKIPQNSDDFNKKSFFWIGNKPLSLPTTMLMPGHGNVFRLDDGIKWKRFPRYWPFVQGIHRSPVNSPHKGQWRVTLVFSFICVWINGWVNNLEAGDLRRYRSHYDVTVMKCAEISYYAWIPRVSAKQRIICELN